MKKLLLVIAIGLAMSACSSGGSGSNESAKNTNIPVKNTNVPTNGQQDKPTVSKPAIPVKSIDLVSEAYKAQVKALKTIEVTDDNKTVKIDVYNEPVGIVQKNLRDGYVKGINLIYSSTGAWLPHNAKIASNGIVTDERVSSDNFDIYGLTTKEVDVPKSGTAQYKGISLGAIVSGKMVLDVDFADKTVSGKLYDRVKNNGQSLDDITLHKGIITIGNSNIRNQNVVAISGRATYSGVEGSYIGGFFGPKAEEVSGAVGNDDYGIYEAFSGSRGEIK